MKEKAWMNVFWIKIELRHFSIFILIHFLCTLRFIYGTLFPKYRKVSFFLSTNVARAVKANAVFISVLNIKQIEDLLNCANKLSKLRLFVLQVAFLERNRRINLVERSQKTVYINKVCFPFCSAFADNDGVTATWLTWDKLFIRSNTGKYNNNAVPQYAYCVAEEKLI